jgi:hypothetical protein
MNSLVSLSKVVFEFREKEERLERMQ